MYQPWYSARYITAAYGNLQQDYHSAAANPSSGGHEDIGFRFTAPYGYGGNSAGIRLVSSCQHGLRKCETMHGYHCEMEG